MPSLTCDFEQRSSSGGGKALQRPVGSTYLEFGGEVPIEAAANKAMCSGRRIYKVVLRMAQLLSKARFEKLVAEKVAEDAAFRVFSVPKARVL